MKNIGVFIFIGVLVLAIGGGITYSVINREKDNPKGTVGNNSGNLVNRGLFCEDDGIVYFSNPYDDYKIYSMSPDQRNIRKISEVPAEYINSGGDYLYFYQTSSLTGEESKILGMNGIYGVCRISKKGGGAAQSIDRSVCDSLILIDNDVYYRHYSSKEGLTLYKSDKMGKEKGMLADEDISPCCTRNGSFIFADKSNNMLMSSFNPDMGSKSVLADIRAYDIISDGMYLYYMNVDDKYALYRYSTADGSNEKLTSDRVDVFNVYGNSIFYQKNSKSEPCLMRMDADGSDPRVVSEGNYSSISCTSTYTYFTDFSATAPIYQTPTSGQIDVRIFQPAQ